MHHRNFKRKIVKSLSLDDLLEGILAGKISSLSKGITLCESRKSTDRQLANQLIQKCLPHSGNSIRIGITGVPGVGKSTFIESFGLYLINQHAKKLAVLAVDPSSCLLYTSPSPRDKRQSRMPSSA